MSDNCGTDNVWYASAYLRRNTFKAVFRSCSSSMSIVSFFWGNRSHAFSAATYDMAFCQSPINKERAPAMMWSRTVSGGPMKEALAWFSIRRLKGTLCMAERPPTHQQR